MGIIVTFKSKITPFAPVCLLISFWASIWFGIQAGNIETIGSGTNIWSQFQSIRSVAPVFSGFVAVIVIAYTLVNSGSIHRLFYGPLGLVFVYGLIGTISIFYSPDSTVALYWVGIYISVPLVVWAIATRREPIAQVSKLLLFNWFIVFLAAAILLIMAFSFLNLHKIILEPSNLLECKLRTVFHGESWLELTAGNLRSTGVGRYAAIAAVLALGGIWRGRGKYIWGLVFLATMLLLLTSGARTSFIGFGVAAPLVIFLQGGWKAIAITFSGLAAASGILWSFGLDKPIMESCFLSGYQAGTSLLRIQPEMQPSDSITILPSVHPTATRPTSVPLPTITAPTISRPTSVAPSAQSRPQTTSEISVDDPLVDPPGEASGLLSQKLDHPKSPVTPVAPLAQSTSQTTSEISTDEPSINSSGETSDIPSQSNPTLLPQPTEPVQSRATPLPTPIYSPLPTSAASSLSTPLALNPEDVKPDSVDQVENLTIIDSQIKASQPNDDGPATLFGRILVPSGFYTFSGRSVVWEAGWEFINKSPLLGYGFQGDRLVLGTHIHNAMLHALIQAGWIGFIPFIIGLIWAWILLIKTLSARSTLPSMHQHLLVQTAGILAFLTIRSIWESTGAFFGVDWLILSVMLLYIQLVEIEIKRIRNNTSTKRTSET